MGLTHTTRIAISLRTAAIPLEAVEIFPPVEVPIDLTVVVIPVAPSVCFFIHLEVTCTRS
jgi:hypothetical protein